MLLFNTFFNKLSKLSIESLTEEKKKKRKLQNIK